MTNDVNEVLRKVFVYGTLRSEQTNHMVIEWAANDIQVAELDGYAMYGSGVPHIVPNPNYRVIGELVTLDDAAYDEAMQGLDMLEGFRPGRPDYSMYVREAVEVRVTETGELVRAWAYIGGTIARGGSRHATLIPDGDWVRRCHATL